VILHGVVAYLAGLWLGPFLSLFPLSLLGALLGFGLLLTFLEQRGSLSRWGGLLLFAVVVAGMARTSHQTSGSHCRTGSVHTRWCDSARGGATQHVLWKATTDSWTDSPHVARAH
jgi:hypothetical protein